MCIGMYANIHMLHYIIICRLYATIVITIYVNRNSDVASNIELT